MVGLTVEVHNALGEHRAAEPATPEAGAEAGADAGDNKALARWKRAVAVNALLQPYTQVGPLPVVGLTPNPKQSPVPPPSQEAQQCCDSFGAHVAAVSASSSARGVILLRDQLPDSVVP